MDSRNRMRIGMVVLLAGIGVIVSACDNDKLDSEAGLRLFSGKEKVVGPGYTPPPDDTYTLPEDTSPADQRTEDHDLFIHDETDGALPDVCMPDCSGKECGDDGCGGSCGNCSGCKSVCSGGQCEAQPQADSGCFDNDICWKDSCGAWGEKVTECGQAGCKPGSKVCSGCEELCKSIECGENSGCNCGACPSGKSCQQNKCVVECGDGQCGAGEDYCNCPGDCAASTCAGCCQGTVCKAGTSNSECGKNGAACASCSGGKTCQSQACAYKCGDGVCAAGQEDYCNCPGDCAASTCAGCCQGTVCKAGTSNSECGKNGASCANCTASGKVCQSQGCVVPPTWTDPTSGLTWQVTPTGGIMNWSNAKAHCAALSLDGGGWYLPSISELRSLIRGCPGTVTGGACEVTDSCLSYSLCWDEGACYSCSGGDGPADGCYWPDSIIGTCGWYWSSSPVEDFDDFAWHVDFNNGRVNRYDVDYYHLRVRCVR